MRQLTVYHGPTSNDEPHILSFQEHAAQIRRSRFRLVGTEPTQASKPTQAPTIKLHTPQPKVTVTRELVQQALSMQARAQHKHHCCPTCRRVTVEPIELHDGILTRNGAIVSGSATVVGFSCNSCGNEWSV